MTYSCVVVIRGEDMTKIRCAISDLLEYGGLTFVEQPTEIDAGYADEILESVMQATIIKSCEAAVLIPVQEKASEVIGRIRNMHSPAHIIVVSPRHEIYNELTERLREKS